MFAKRGRKEQGHEGLEGSAVPHLQVCGQDLSNEESDQGGRMFRLQRRAKNKFLNTTSSRSSRSRSQDRSNNGSSQPPTSITTSPQQPALPHAPKSPGKASSAPSQVSPQDTASVQAQTAYLGVSETSAVHQGADKLVIKGDDAWNRAFRQACATRDAQDRAALAQTDDICEMFTELERKSMEHKQASCFQRGARSLGSVLNGLNFLLSLSDPVSNIEPCTSSALAIVKAVTSVRRSHFFPSRPSRPMVGIAMCGAAQEMQTCITTLLKAIPRVDFCDAVHTGQRVALVDTALVTVYHDLLDFFFAARKLLTTRHFVIGLSQSMVQGNFATIVASFEDHVGELERRIAHETNAMLRQASRESVQENIRQLLEKNRFRESEYHNMLRTRADEACEWITSHANFVEWTQASRGPKTLALYGMMGSGKTVTMAYVVDHLRVHSRSARLVCSYFCKNDGETGNVGNLYRSLLAQLMASNDSLPWFFHQWYKTKQGTLQIDPTESFDELRSLILAVLSVLRQSVYLVIDGLDECEEDSRRHLLELLKEISVQPRVTRVLVSSRYDDLHQDMPADTPGIWLERSEHRDTVIVRHLVGQYMRNTDEGTRNYLIEHLPGRTQGSAIWARMVLQFLRRTKKTKLSLIKATLERMPPPQQLSNVYMKLFDEVVDSLPENRWLLARSLDILAAARRGLTLRELSYVVNLEHAESSIARRLSNMEEVMDEDQVHSLIRPFVIITKTLSTGSIHIALIHQSLKETILRLEPFQWSSDDPNLAMGIDGVRYNALDGLAARLCVDYLLLGEFDQINYVRDPREKGWSDLEVLSQVTIGTDLEVLPDFVPLDPFDRGFGGFYSYAARYWNVHFQAASSDVAPTLDQLIELSRPASLRLNNWKNFLRQSDRRVELNSGLAGYRDPLALVTAFGPEALLTELLDRGLEAAGIDSERQEWAIWNAFDVARREEKFGYLAILIDHPATAETLKCYEVFARLLDRWPWLTPADRTMWKTLLDAMFISLKSTVVAHGNLILLEACKVGCFPLVEKLFETAESNADLKHHLMQRSTDEHGPIGWAGHRRNVRIMRFLCAREDMAVHLHCTDRNGDNIWIFLAADRCPAVLRVLIEFFPEGINEIVGGTSALQAAVNEVLVYAEEFEAVKVLLIEGGADMTVGDVYFAPLKCAVRNGVATLCRILIVDGYADPWSVVSVSDAGRPYLLEKCLTPGLFGSKKDEETLREICSLMPMTVSHEHLGRTNIRAPKDGRREYNIVPHGNDT